MTGWTGEGPETEGPAMPITARMIAHREQKASLLEDALARSRAAEAREILDEAASAPDPDERAANLLARGYAPGQISQLAQRYADTMAELEAERGKIERAALRQERIARDHAAGRITAFDIAGMGEADEGDAHRAEQLDRRAGNLRRQLDEAQQITVTPRRSDPLEAAASRAHAAFTETTRAKMAAAQSGRTEPRPFASRGGFGARAEEQPVDCPDCHDLDVDWETSVMIHKQADVDGVDLPQRSTRASSVPVAYR